MTSTPHTFYEFFAGGGMARLGLGDQWKCLFANEWSEKKASAYRANFPPARELVVDDVWNLDASDLPGQADLAWASFPCQDLSLAGNGAGLDGDRSGTVVKFWDLMHDLAQVGRGVPIVVLENVVGALTSNGGSDFRAIAELTSGAGFRFGGMVIDAARFVPQSRPRLFIVAISDLLRIPDESVAAVPGQWHTPRLREAVEKLPAQIRDRWVWWNPRCPLIKGRTLDEIIDYDDPIGWHTDEQTRRLLDLMSDINRAKVQQAKAYGKRIVGTVYKRVRNENGIKSQRAEVRFDQISGCLRTPTGGSSRQTILVVERKSVRSRLLTPREAARLMGLPETYRLPPKYNDAYHISGDGVVVPVVSWLEQNLLRPLASHAELMKAA